MSMLKVEGLNVYYGSIHAIKGVSFEVNQGEIVTMIGANGAGKSTTMNTVAGLLKPKSGSITISRPPRRARSCRSGWRSARRGGASSSR